ncbi:MAG: hypothetical protein ACR2N3_07170 [Pyrinomonadaceae bacterium]
MNKTIEQETLEQSDLWDYVEKQKPSIEEALRKHLPLAPSHIETEFNAAVRYALFPGGKRLRPVLTLLGAEIVGGAAESVLPSAVAVEFIQKILMSSIQNRKLTMRNLKLRNPPSAIRLPISFSSRGKIC